MTITRIPKGITVALPATRSSLNSRFSPLKTAPALERSARSAPSKTLVKSLLGLVPLLLLLLMSIPWATAAAASTSVSGVAKASMSYAVAVPAAQHVACSGQKDAASCDADGDAIPDGVEVVVCGSGTCATGREDTDVDGIPDWTEITACGDAKCADPTTDTDSDGVPDYAEDLACGSATCSNGRDDADGNRVADWIDFVICGTAGCATGEEDFDGNGVSDAAELAACVKEQPNIFGIPLPGTGPDSTGFLASTGFQAWVFGLFGVILLGAGALLIYRRKATTPAISDENSSMGGDA
ncbi:LPXTG cell wall anchor domain-containing protein [Paenarthrobacter sp. NPDC090522]|uniref:LPXTG cell wall anchor domain-containing protein n=1 Tax=Paenarthrobacter sp. NPDC090522 TaxID=3364383 RepID=UPI0037F37E34